MALLRLATAFCLGILVGMVHADTKDWAAQMEAGWAALGENEADHLAAAAHFQAALTLAEELGPGQESRVAQTALQLAVVYEGLARYVEASGLYRRAKQVYEAAKGPDELLKTIDPLQGLARISTELGRYSEAEADLTRALSILSATRVVMLPWQSPIMSHLANVYRLQGRFPEAEQMFERALEIDDTILRRPALVALHLEGLALTYHAQGKFREALPLFERALQVRESGTAPENRAVVFALVNIAQCHRAMRQFALAERFDMRALELAGKTFGSDHPEYGLILVSQGFNSESLGRFAEAEKFYERARAIFAANPGPGSVQMANVLYNLARVLGKQGRQEDALQDARLGTGILERRLARKGRRADIGLLAERRTQVWGPEVHLSLIAAHDDSPRRDQESKVAEAFLIAQFARASVTADQVERISARFASGGNVLGGLVRERQDAFSLVNELEARIVRSMTATSPMRSREALDGLRNDSQAAEARLASYDARLEREFPAYWDLVSGRPLEIGRARDLLHPGEGIIAFIFTPGEGFVLGVTKDRAELRRLGIARSVLEETVRGLRKQLDLGTIDDPAELATLPFQVAAAHELYLKLIAPVEHLLAEVRHLIVVPDGALQSLPPGVLVMRLPPRPVQGVTDLASVQWLGSRFAISVLPAVNSLRALRQFARPSASPESFGGFGDPDFDGDVGPRGRISRTLFGRGAIANVDEVRKFPRLPESGQELRAIAGALKAAPGSVRLGAAASESAVKNADLTRYRNIAFATHGLIAGELEGLAEPALALTPPAVGSDLDDGLLTASEVARLRLDADMVVLSACNTAAPDGTPGAEGLSGLAKAFFYAGARSLLVSHWTVSSDATVALTTGMFSEIGMGVERSEALRRSMVSVMHNPDKPYYAHPAFWAPFVMIGDGRR